MNIQLQTYPHFDTPGERLTITLFIALVLHVFLAFGVSFELESSANPSNNKLDIVLVQTQTLEAPEEADYLAQVNQAGGGAHEEEVRASTPITADFPSPTPQLTSAYVPPQLAAAEQRQIEQMLTAQHAPEKIYQTPYREQIDNDQTQTGDALQTVPLTQSQSQANLLLNMRQTVASIQADLDEDFRHFKNRPPHKYPPMPSSKASSYAQYMDTLIRTIEKAGVEHYPALARERNLSGSLIVDLGLNTDGTIAEIKIVTSSGHPVLDDATRQIARLAGPYPSLSKALQKELGLSDNGVLHTINTWRFDSQGGLAELLPEKLPEPAEKRSTLPRADGGEVRT